MKKLFIGFMLASGLALAAPTDGGAPLAPKDIGLVLPIEGGNVTLDGGSSVTVGKGLYADEAATIALGQNIAATTAERDSLKTSMEAVWDVPRAVVIIAGIVAVGAAGVGGYLIGKGNGAKK